MFLLMCTRWGPIKRSIWRLNLYVGLVIETYTLFL